MADPIFSPLILFFLIIIAWYVLGYCGFTNINHTCLVPFFYMSRLKVRGLRVPLTWYEHFLFTYQSRIMWTIRALTIYNAFITFLFVAAAITVHDMFYGPVAAGTMSLTFYAVILSMQIATLALYKYWFSFYVFGTFGSIVWALIIMIVAWGTALAAAIIIGLTGGGATGWTSHVIAALVFQVVGLAGLTILLIANCIVINAWKVCMWMPTTGKYRETFHLEHYLSYTYTKSATED